MKLGTPAAMGRLRADRRQSAEFEWAGLDRVMIPEGYGFDAVTQMGYVAARTCTVELASGILPMFSLTPTTLAMTTPGLDLRNGRAGCELLQHVGGALRLRRRGPLHRGVRRITPQGLWPCEG